MTLIHDLLRETAARSPDRIALISEGRTRSFAELDEDSDRIAAELQRGGVARGDRVAWFASNSSECVAALFGILKAGAVVVPVGSLTGAAAAAEMLTDCGAVGAIAGENVGALVGAMLASVPSLKHVIWTGSTPGDGLPGRCLDELRAGRRTRPADLGLIDQDLGAIVYTSGSTGRPKGAMLTHGNLVHATWSIAAYLGNVSSDVVTCVLPITHTYGLMQVLVGARVGYAVVLEKSFAYPFDVLRRVQEHRATALPGVPTMFAHLLRMAPLEGLDLSSLRYLTNAGAALPVAHVMRVSALFPQAQLFCMYGQTECVRACSLDPARLPEKAGSVGHAIPNCEVYVVDERGHRVGHGITGELVVRGASVMRGYWRRPEETARALREGDVPGEKVLHTGDLFRTDTEGLLYFVGRQDDVFKSKGEKVSPSEIEDVISQLADVVHAAVVGVDDPTDGKAVRAYVVLREGAALPPRDILRHCRSKLPSYMVPRDVQVRASLPRTPTGKLDRRALTPPTQEPSSDSS